MDILAFYLNHLDPLQGYFYRNAHIQVICCHISIPESLQEMDIPSILDNDTDKAVLPQKQDNAADLSNKFSQWVKQASSRKSNTDDNTANSSNTDSSIIMGDYFPPVVKQWASSPQVCLACGSLEPSQSKLITHISTFHPLYLYPCRTCNRTFLSHNLRYKHKISHTVATLFCGIYAKGFHSNTELNRHMPKHSGTIPFSCQNYPKGYYDKKDLSRHIELHNSKSYQYLTCQKSHKSKDRLYVNKRGQQCHMAKCTPCGKYNKAKKAAAVRFGLNPALR